MITTLQCMAVAYTRLYRGSGECPLKGSTRGPTEVRDPLTGLQLHSAWGSHKSNDKRNSRRHDDNIYRARVSWPGAARLLEVRIIIQGRWQTLFRGCELSGDDRPRASNCEREEGGVIARVAAADRAGLAAALGDCERAWV